MVSASSLAIWTLGQHGKNVQKLHVCVDTVPLCQRCPWLFGNCVSVVIDYAETVSALSLTMRKLCQLCPLLFRHCVSVVIDYAETVSALSLTIQKLCQCCPWLFGHHVSVVIDYLDTVSAWSLTIQTPCQHCPWLWRNCVSIVVDYLDMLNQIIDYGQMSMTTWTPKANFKSLSLTLKDQSGEIKNLENV